LIKDGFLERNTGKKNVYVLDVRGLGD